MLAFDALVESAKSRGLPPTKTRGILREYLQVLILKGLYKTDMGRKLCFTGGTYLRLVHGFKRFSEDLDFNVRRLVATNFENCIEELITGLGRVGLRAKIRFAHWDNMLVAKLIFPEVERLYDVVSKHSKKTGIIIKIEAYKPAWKIPVETQVISAFGETYPCICTGTGALFADKIDALTKKMRGRHLYDTIFMLSNGFPIDRDVLSAFNIKQNPLEVMLSRVQGFSDAELKRQAEILRPFLFDESEADLLVRAHDIVPKLIEKYRKLQPGAEK